jgi:HTH-type transcriptional regulator / antitoxin HipB
MDQVLSICGLDDSATLGHHLPVTASFVDPLRTPTEVALELAARVRTLRLARNWKRDTLAARAGVTSASLKRFERTGQISLESFLKLCDTLERLDELDRVLRPPAARSMKELEQAAQQQTPKRGRL